MYLEGGLDEARQLFGRLLFNGEVTDEIYYSDNLVVALSHSVVLCTGCVFAWPCPFPLVDANVYVHISHTHELLIR